MKYTLSLAGGTFDQLHIGHEAFLRAILSESEHLLLGITSDTYVRRNKSDSNVVQPYSIRKQRIRSFLKRENALHRVTISQIESALCPVSWELLPIKAIFVTEDTISGADLINDDRRKKDMSLLPIITVPTVFNRDRRRICSTDIRNGYMNREGEPYARYLLQKQDFLLPTVARKLLKEPWGDILKDERILRSENPDQLIAVGDIVSQTCNMMGLQQKLSVIDLTVRRQWRFNSIRDIGFSGQEIMLLADNPPGYISQSLRTVIFKTIKLLSQSKRIVLIVNGEEDLAVIPLLLIAPLGYVILYGQPHKGIVRLPVNTRNKQKAQNILSKFILV